MLSMQVTLLLNRSSLNLILSVSALPSSRLKEITCYLKWIVHQVEKEIGDQLLKNLMKKFANLKSK